MANYFVRLAGSDSNNGTSAATAWRTFGKLLGASGMASGDVAYIGAGIYRETPTVAMTSATVETKILADWDGSHTGDAGEVVLSAFTSGDLAAVSSSSTLTLSARDFLTFEGITFIGGNTTNSCVNGTTTNSTNLTFRRCTFIATTGAGTCVVYTGLADVASAWVFDSCIFLSQNICITATFPTSTVADYDTQFGLINCLLFSFAQRALSYSSSGANSFKPGGGYLRNSTILTGNICVTISGFSATTQHIIRDSVFIGGEGLQAVTTTGISENNNWFFTATARANVTAGVLSQLFTSCAPMLDFGQSWLNGLMPRPFLAPLRGSPLAGFGNDMSVAPTTDATGRPRPGNTTMLGDSGTATSGATTTITDSGKTWGVNQWVDWLVKITSGTGSGQIKRVSSNTATALTISGAAPAGGLWATTPDATSVYQLYRGPSAETGKATSGSVTTLVDSGAAWGTTRWVGMTVSLTGGTGSGQTAVVTSHTATTLTFATLGTAPDSTTTYSLYQATSVDTNQNAVGYVERHDDAQKETVTTDAGSVAIRIEGPGDHEFRIPVDAVSTTITVNCRFDTAHGTANKPQAILLDAPQIGVTTQTVTSTSAVDTWSTLTFSAFTPTAKGVVVVRLRSRAAAVLGRAYWDTWTIV